MDVEWTEKLSVCLRGRSVLGCAKGREQDRTYVALILVFAGVDWRGLLTDLNGARLRASDAAVGLSGGNVTTFFLGALFGLGNSGCPRGDANPCEAQPRAAVFAGKSKMRPCSVFSDCGGVDCSCNERRFVARGLAGGEDSEGKSTELDMRLAALKGSNRFVVRGGECNKFCKESKCLRMHCCR